MRPLRALDLFCGAGGAALGLLRAGFDEVVGVDTDPRCAAVYPGSFVEGDALAPHTLAGLGRFDLVWASPPCQRWSSATLFRPDNRRAPDLLPELRSLLATMREPWVIENVPAAPIEGHVWLRGPSVGLTALERLRKFELGRWSIPWGVWPPRPAGSIAEGTVALVKREAGIPCRRIRAKRAALRPDLPAGRCTREEMLAAMGLPPDCRWTQAQLGEAVPPAYAEWIGTWAAQLARGGPLGPLPGPQPLFPQATSTV